MLHTHIYTHTHRYSINILNLFFSHKKRTIFILILNYVISTIVEIESL